MKICWDNLREFTLGKRNKELRKGHYTYIEKDSCVNCGEPYLMNKYSPTDCCCVSCGKISSDYNHNEKTRKKIGKASLGNKNMLGKTHSLKTRKKLSKITSSRTGENASGWKGGVTEKNVPLYDTFAKQIGWADNIRLVKKDGLGLMEVTCTKCGRWYIPKATNVHYRLRYLKGQVVWENRFYCSEKCKNDCEIYGQHLWPKHNKPRRKQEFDGFDENDLKIWRIVVLEKTNYICEYCGEKATIAHHIRQKN